MPRVNQYLMFLAQPTLKAKTIYIDRPSDDPPSCLISLTVNFTRPEFNSLCNSASDSDDLEAIEHEEEKSSFTQLLVLPEDWLDDTEASMAAMGELLAGVGIPPSRICSRLASDMFAAIIKSDGDIEATVEALVTSLPRGDGLEGLLRGRREKPATCSICLEDIPARSESTMMPCWHCFHGDCILKWLEASKTCPLCRSVMI